MRGKWNLVADALSRRADLYRDTSLYTGEDDEVCAPIMSLNAMKEYGVALDEKLLQGLLSDYEKDSEFKKLKENERSKLVKTDQGLWFYRSDELPGLMQMYVPDGRLRLTLMHDAHDAVAAGHLGIDKTYEHLRRRFAWPRMKKDVYEYVRSCNSCQ